MPNESDLVITLQGIAIEEDENSKKRKLIEMKLGHKEYDITKIEIRALKIVSEIIDSILGNMNLDKAALPQYQKKNPDLTLFEWSNRELNVTIPFLYLKGYVYSSCIFKV